VRQPGALVVIAAMEKKAAASLGGRYNGGYEYED
jgi:hypothetical protein